MFVNVILQKFEDLTTAAGLPVTVQHMEDFCTAWQKYDPDGDGWILLTDLAPLTKSLSRQIGYDPLAGEHPIDLAELRLPPLPNGEFSRFLLDPRALAIAKGLPPPAADGAAAAGGADPEDSAAAAESGGGSGSDEDENADVVNFDELLYACCERKWSAALPRRPARRPAPRTPKPYTLNPLHLSPHVPAAFGLQLTATTVGGALCFGATQRHSTAEREYADSGAAERSGSESGAHKADGRGLPGGREARGPRGPAQALRQFLRLQALRGRRGRRGLHGQFAAGEVRIGEREGV